jgi:hypothetical protein
MPTNTSKYNEEELIKILEQLRAKNTEIKELIHTNVIYHQSKVPTKREMVTLGKKFTDMKPVVNKALKKRDKKEGKKTERKIRISRIHPKLARFLRLKERGLPSDVYYDAIVMSYFADWVVREGRSDGVNVKLNGKDDPFVVLFREELSQPGSAANQLEEDENLFQAPAYDNDGNAVLDKNGNQLLATSVLDRDGNVAKPFPRCKHMFIFKNMYVQKRKLQGDTYITQREVITGEEYTNALPAIERERDLFKDVLKEVRKKYKDTLKRYEELSHKQEQAKSLGDTSVRTSLLLCKKDLDDAAKKYITILNNNYLTHKIKV